MLRSPWRRPAVVPDKNPRSPRWSDTAVERARNVSGDEHTRIVRVVTSTISPRRRTRDNWELENPDSVNWERLRIPNWRAAIWRRAESITPAHGVMSASKPESRSESGRRCSHRHTREISSDHAVERHDLARFHAERTPCREIAIQQNFPGPGGGGGGRCRARGARCGSRRTAGVRRDQA